MSTSFVGWTWGGSIRTRLPVIVRKIGDRANGFLVVNPPKKDQIATKPTIAGPQRAARLTNTRTRHNHNLRTVRQRATTVGFASIEVATRCMRQGHALN